MYRVIYYLLSFTLISRLTNVWRLNFDLVNLSGPKRETTIRQTGVSDDVLLKTRKNWKCTRNTHKSFLHCHPRVAALASWRAWRCCCGSGWVSQSPAHPSSSRRRSRRPAVTGRPLGRSPRRPPLQPPPPTSPTRSRRTSINTSKNYSNYYFICRGTSIKIAPLWICKWNKRVLFHCMIIISGA